MPKLFSDLHSDKLSSVITAELGDGYLTKFKFCSRTKKIYGLRRFFGKYDIYEDCVLFFNYLGNSTFALKVFDHQSMNHLRDIEGFFRFEDFMYPPVDMEVVHISDDDDIVKGILHPI